MKRKHGRVVAIIRVSQKGSRVAGEDFYSPDDQRRRIQEYCDRMGYEIVAWYEEIDVSGLKLPLSKRVKGLLPAIEMIERNEADILMVAYFDRLVRQTKVKLEVFDRLAKAGALFFALDAGELSHDTPVKKFTSTMLMAVAELTGESYAERSAEGQKDAVAKGTQVGPPPLGFKRGRNRILDEHGNGNAKGLVPDWDAVTKTGHKTCDVLLEAWKLADTGAVHNDIRWFLRTHGIERLDVGRMFQNINYKGWIHFGEQIVPEAHDPIIPPDLFDRVAARRTRRSRNELPKYEDRLLQRQKIVKCCNCGSTMQVCRNQIDYPFYRCPNLFDCPKRMNVSAEVVDTMVAEAVKAKLADAKGRAALNKDYQSVVAQRDALSARLSQARRDVVRAGIGQTDEAIEELQKLADELEYAQGEVDRFKEIKKAVGMKDWDKMTLDEKRALVLSLGTVVTIKPSFHPGGALPRAEYLALTWKRVDIKFLKEKTVSHTV